MHLGRATLPARMPFSHPSSLYWPPRIPSGMVVRFVRFKQALALRVTSYSFWSWSVWVALPPHLGLSLAWPLFQLLWPLMASGGELQGSLCFLFASGRVMLKDGILGTPTAKGESTKIQIRGAFEEQKPAENRRRCGSCARWMCWKYLGLYFCRRVTGESPFRGLHRAVKYSPVSLQFRVKGHPKCVC